jgi:formylglycine-generating enzyme required for sulfatase activity
MRPFLGLSRLMRYSSEEIAHYFFTNHGDKELFLEEKGFDSISLAEVVSQYSPESANCIIFSDVGRQGYSEEKHSKLEKFINYLTKNFKKVAWINPYPPERWSYTTAQEIADMEKQTDDFKMFPLGLKEFEDTIDWLKEDKIIPSYQIYETANTTNDEAYYSYSPQARLKVLELEYGESTKNLAKMAAFPLGITPELLHYLRQQQKPPQAPWYGVADILLSSIVRHVSDDLYEMDAEVKELLLAQLTTDELRELAEHLLKYISSQINSEASKTAYFKNQKWVALSYLEPGQAFYQLRKSLLESLKKNDFSDLVKFTSASRNIAKILVDYQPLLEHIESIAAYIRGDLNLEDASEEQIRTNLITTLTNYNPIIHRELVSYKTVLVNKQGSVVKNLEGEVYYFDEPLGEGVEPLRMMYIPPGQYWMGSESDKGGYGDEKPQHLVTVRAFYMSQTLITQEQWQAVAALPQEAIKLNPNCARFKGNSLPVERVSWREALEFCARISRYTGRKYRLPSEGEWEYACRAIVKPEALGEKGKKKPVYQPFHFGETLTEELANYRATSIYQEEKAGKYREKTTPVRTFPPNAFGLYDMHGNVLEWCLDPWHGSYKGAPEDSRVWDEENNENHYQNVLNNIDVLVKDKRTHVLRGGSWVDSPWVCRSAYRLLIDIRDWRVNDIVGFRLVCPPQD